MSKTIMAPDINGKLHELNIDDLRWRPSAYGIVIKDGALLVAPQKNGYDLPGGGVELGEQPEEALIREIKEETGIITNNPRIMACASNYFVLPASDKGVNIQSILLYYICDYVGGKLTNAGFTEEEKNFSLFPEWIKLDEFYTTVTDDKLGTVYDWRGLVKNVAEI